MPAEWRRTPFGYERDEYRIRLIPEARRYRWRLEVARSGPDGPRWWAVSYHRRLRTAQVRAEGIARERRRRDRIAWRIVAGGVSLFVSIVTITLEVSFGMVLAAATGFAFAIRFWLEAIALLVAPGDHALTDAWPHLERAALRIAASVRRRSESRPGAGAPVLHVSPPDPEATSEPDAESGYRHASPMHLC
jgi:hypothetical protein